MLYICRDQFWKLEYKFKHVNIDEIRDHWSSDQWTKLRAEKLFWTFKVCYLPIITKLISFQFDDETTTTTDEKAKLTFFVKLIERIQVSKMELYKKNENARINSLTSQVNSLSTQIHQIEGSNNECNQRINSLNQHYTNYKNSTDAEIRTLGERLKQICPK